MIKSQKGFLLIIAILLILVMSALSIAISYMILGSTATGANFLFGTRALYIAEGGLEKTTRSLLTPFLTGSALRIACANVTGNANLTNSSLGAGTFSATGTTNYTNSTLSGALTTTATTVTLANASSFNASGGRAVIEKENINYIATSGNNLIGVTRGVSGTIAAVHAVGAYVSQYQCNVGVVADVPNATTPLGEREIRQAVQLQEAWAVGNITGNNFVMTRWNRPTELAWTNSSFTDMMNKDNLRSISLLSNAQGWAVGEEVNTNFSILRLAGTAWSVLNLAGACTGQNLLGVSAVSSQEAWAVGVRSRITLCTLGNYRYTILKWNGSTWTKLAPTSIPADGAATVVQDLNSVSVISTTGATTGNFGFAVGAAGRILSYNGSVWTAITSPVTTALNSVTVVSGNEAWAVGANGRILKFNGTSWSIFTSPISTNLNSIYMLDTNADGLANFGWAVGDGGVAIFFNGTSWSTQNPGGGNLLGVAVYSYNDAWATGLSGRLIHWDGTAWTSIASGVTTDLRAIDIIPPDDYPFAAWQEVF